MRREIAPLTGLRGVAACWVVVYHVHEFDPVGGPFGALLKHGYLAVDVFFILSGFVMALSYQAVFAAEFTGRNYANLLLRRVARIYSLYGSETKSFSLACGRPHNRHWLVKTTASRVWSAGITLKALRMIGYVCKLRWHGIGRRAVTSLEYALIAAFIAIVIVSSVAAVGTKLKVPFTTVSTTLAN